jgi:hypothetical protein
MKLKYIMHAFAGLTFLWMNGSCDSYLDKLPDNSVFLLILIMSFFLLYYAVCYRNFQSESLFWKNRLLCRFQE